jgi:D-alanine-D-alanine ligase
VTSHRPLRILHLAGSPSSDFFADLSLLYASGCLDATAAPELYEPHIAHVTHGGSWRFPVDLSAPALAAATPMSLPAAIARIGAIGPDVAVPQMFCGPGMTTYRALLEVLAVPFVGNRSDVMAIGAHKARARAIVAAAGVRVPAAELLRRGSAPTLAPPVVVKPCDSDNSVGVTLVRDERDMGSAIHAAFEHSNEVLVEEYVELGREVRCGVLQRGDDLLVLPLEEYAVDPLTKPIRGMDDKLARGHDGRLRLVAKDAEHAWIVDPADPLTERVGAAARAAHRALGCRHYSLFDFRVDPAGQPWFLEAGLYCSFAPASVLAVMAAAAGIGVTDLFDQMVAQAMCR